MFLRPAGLVFLLSLVLVIMMFEHVSGVLPERVASHFGAGGEADGWMTRGGFLKFFAAVVAGTSALMGGLAWLSPRIRSSAVNLPDRDYWLTPERRGQTDRRIQDYLLAMAAATNVLYLALLQSTVVANAMPEPRLAATFWVATAGYMLFVTIWTVWWLRAWRRPRNPRSLPPAIVLATVLTLVAVGDVRAEAPVVDTRGKLEFRSADGDFRFRVDGRVHADGNWFQDDNDVDFGSGTQLRRGRLGMEGRLWRDWHFKFSYDFTGSGRAGVQDAFMRYTGLGRPTVTVGHFKEPISLEVLTGANSVPFVERALPTVLAPSRSLGVAAWLPLHDRLATTLGVFGEGIAKLSDTDPATPGLDEGWAASGRVVYTPVRADDRLLHLGASAGYRRANDHGGTHVATPLRIRQRPEASLTSIRLVDTGDLADTDHLTVRGLEAAWIHGPVSLQGEYLAMTVARATDGSVDPTLQGFYVMASWLVTGESRRYSSASGSFSNPRVRRIAGQGGPGAWELLARYSQIDLTDQPERTGGVLGGEQTNVTVGVTWYPNDNLRFMLNYVKVLELERPGHAMHGTEPGIVLVRTQVVW